LGKWLVESGTVDHKDDAAPLIKQLVAEKYLVFSEASESEKSRYLLWGEESHKLDKAHDEVRFY
jgi:hypothetical protein